jgi:hypothetical protein
VVVADEAMAEFIELLTSIKTESPKNAAVLSRLKSQLG